MAKKIFISASNTGVGKTHTILRLIKETAKENQKVGIFKPIETGIKDIPEDASKLLSVCKLFNPTFDFSLNDVCPYQFSLPAAPFVARKDTKIDIGFLQQKCDELSQKCDILFIEGAGGLYTPIDLDFFMIDLAYILADEVIFVVHSALGCINDALLGINALQSKGIKHTLYINLYREKESFFEISYPFFEKSALVYRLID